jgi:hypothetical protein
MVCLARDMANIAVMASRSRLEGAELYKELQRARHDCVLLLEQPHLHLAHGLFHPRPPRQAGTE